MILEGNIDGEFDHDSISCSFVREFLDAFLRNLQVYCKFSCAHQFISATRVQKSANCSFRHFTVQGHGESGEAVAEMELPVVLDCFAAMRSDYHLTPAQDALLYRVILRMALDPAPCWPTKIANFDRALRHHVASAASARLRRLTAAFAALRAASGHGSAPLPGIASGSEDEEDDGNRAADGAGAQGQVRRRTAENTHGATLKIDDRNRQFLSVL